MRILCWTLTSSHFGSAEKEFRFPLEYGNQRASFGRGGRSPAAEPVCWEIKKAGENHGDHHGADRRLWIEGFPEHGRLHGSCGLRHHLCQLRDFARKPEDYDRVITGDLGSIGQRILLALLREQGIDLHRQHLDCGMLIYDQGHPGYPCGAAAGAAARRRC